MPTCLVHNCEAAWRFRLSDLAFTFVSWSNLLIPINGLAYRWFLIDATMPIVFMSEMVLSYLSSMVESCFSSLLLIYGQIVSRGDLTRLGHINILLDLSFTRDYRMLLYMIGMMEKMLGFWSTNSFFPFLIWEVLGLWPSCSRMLWPFADTFTNQISSLPWLLIPSGQKSSIVFSLVRQLLIVLTLYYGSLSRERKHSSNSLIMASLALLLLIFILLSSRKEVFHIFTCSSFYTLKIAFETLIVRGPLTHNSRAHCLST